MKKLTVICCIMAMSITMMACGKKEEVTTPETEIMTEQAAETTEAAPEETPQTEAVETEEADAVNDKEAGEAASEDASGAQTEGGYEDNFAVDSEAAAAYAEKIKTAVAEQNIEALADLTSYPVYVGFAEEGMVVNSREEFVALGAERIFTPEMTEAVGAADVSNLSPSMAGFVLNPNGRPDIIFGVVEGGLGIVGINY